MRMDEALAARSSGQVIDTKAFLGGGLGSGCLNSAPNDGGSGGTTKTKDRSERSVSLG